jgi:hypothetical protein
MSAGCSSCLARFCAKINWRKRVSVVIYQQFSIRSEKFKASSKPSWALLGEKMMTSRCSSCLARILLKNTRRQHASMV